MSLILTRCLTGRLLEIVMCIWDEIIAIEDKNHDELENKEDTSTCVKYQGICPRCGADHLEYDGKLNLVCPACQYEAVVGFT